jgi:hypothetical protein
VAAKSLATVKAALLTAPAEARAVILVMAATTMRPALAVAGAVVLMAHAGLGQGLPAAAAVEVASVFSEPGAMAQPGLKMGQQARDRPAAVAPAVMRALAQPAATTAVGVL